MNLVTNEQNGNIYWKSFGNGKVIADSGAGESVLPAAMLKIEPVYHTDKVGKTHRAVGGQALVNKGEQRIKFPTNGVMGSMNFQAIDEVSKPLASAAIIIEKGNAIVSDDENGELYEEPQD